MKTHAAILKTSLVVIAVAMAACDTAPEATAPTDAARAATVDEMASDGGDPTDASAAGPETATVWPRDGAWATSTPATRVWRLASDQGDPLEGYTELDDMVDSATAVIVGQVVNVSTHLSGSEPGDDVRLGLLEVEVIDVVAGDLPVLERGPNGDTVTVAMLGVPGDAVTAAPAIMVLRSVAERLDWTVLDELSGARRDRVEEEYELAASVYNFVSQDGLVVEVDGAATWPAVHVPEQGDASGHSDEPAPTLEDVSPIAAAHQGMPMQELIDLIEATAR